MLEKKTFMETLHSVQEIAKTSVDPLTKEEVLGYFKDMELSAEQKDLVYQFFMRPQEEELPKTESASEDVSTWDVLEEEQENSWETPKEGSQENTKKMSVDGTKGFGRTTNDKAPDWEKGSYFKIYLEEIEELESSAIRNMPSWYGWLAQGDEEAIEPISKGWLSRVIQIAKEYQGGNMMLDDLVQEGNIGLLLGLNELLGTGKETVGKGAEMKDSWIREADTALERSIREAIEAGMLESSGAGEQEKSILAKVSLVHEARKLLVHEKGIEPDLGELAEYTKMPEEEIADILSLVKER